MAGRFRVLQLIPTTEEEAKYFYKRKFSIVNGMHTVLGFMTLREKAPGVSWAVARGAPSAAAAFVSAVVPAVFRCFHRV